MKFDNLYKDWYMTESVLDIPRDGLDPSVFQFPEQGAPMLNARLKQQIIRGVEQIHSIIPVMDYYMIGSILTPKYNDHSDIDVNCEVDSEVNPMALENIVALLKNMNGSLASGTQHPINFYVVKGQFNMDKAEAVYDIANDRWIKEPDTTSFNVRKFMDKFKNKLSGVDLATAELRRNLIDFNELDDLDEHDISNLQVEVQKVISRIESEVEKIIQMYDNARVVRKHAFKKPMSPMEIRKFGIKNNLPENVLYKMLERYYYSDLVSKLKVIVNDGEVDEEDIPKIAKTFKDFVANIG